MTISTNNLTRLTPQIMIRMSYRHGWKQVSNIPTCVYRQDAMYDPVQTNTHSSAASRSDNFLVQL